MHLSHLTDEELLSLAYAEQDPLTTTPMETELVRRFTEAVDTMAAAQPFTDVLDEYDDIKPDQLRDLLERLPDGDVKAAAEIMGLLHEEDLTSVAAVRAALVIATKLQDLTDDPAKALEALETLFNTATA